MAEEIGPLEDELMKYENKWVAILESEDRIVGSGHTAYEAKAQPDANGHGEAALFKVRPFGKYYVYALQ